MAVGLVWFTHGVVSSIVVPWETLHTQRMQLDDCHMIWDCSKVSFGIINLLDFV